MINPAPDRSHHEVTEDGSDICGNVQYFQDYEDLNRNPRTRPILGRVKGIEDFWTPHLDAFYPTFSQHEPRLHENRARSSFNIDVGPQLSGESKQLLPEATNSDTASGSASDQLKLLDLDYKLYKLTYEGADNSYEYRPMSLQQSPALAPIFLLLPAASTVACNNCAVLQYITPFPVNTTPPPVSPETLSSYSDHPYQCPTSTIPSHHEGVRITAWHQRNVFKYENF